MLHEYLEKKRRDSVSLYNASGACHICGSSCRNKRGFSHAIECAATSSSSPGSGGCVLSDRVHSDGYGDGDSMVPRADRSVMRVCSCFDQEADDPDYSPYSIRVCEMCIRNDVNIGRIIHCGMCGVVACDEDCGPVMYECTDHEKWNNAGCIDCRSKSDFSELPLFRRCPPNGIPRATRVCEPCISAVSPWVRHDFECRDFRCRRRLVPSDVVELKRRRQFGSSPLNLLPEDGLVAFVGYLSDTELRSLFLTCSALCRVVERVARDRVVGVGGLLPSGPIVATKRNDGHGKSKDWLYFKGTVDHDIRAPDDQNFWVGLYHFVQKVTRDVFYFDFQMSGPGGDGTAVERFLQRGLPLFAFGRAYIQDGTNSDALIPWDGPTDGMRVRGGTVHVIGSAGHVAPTLGREARTLDHLVPYDGPAPGLVVIGGSVHVRGGAFPTPLALTSVVPLPSTGRVRLIVRIFVPGSGGPRRRAWEAGHYNLGSVGLVRIGVQAPSESAPLAPSNTWAVKSDLVESWLKEDVVAGVDYDAGSGTLVIHSNSHASVHTSFEAQTTVVDNDAPGELYFAAQLLRKAAATPQSILSVREVVDDAEWSSFINHIDRGQMWNF